MKAQDFILFLIISLFCGLGAFAFYAILDINYMISFFIALGMSAVTFVLFTVLDMSIERLSDENKELKKKKKKGADKK